MSSQSKICTNTHLPVLAFWLKFLVFDKTINGTVDVYVDNVTQGTLLVPRAPTGRSGLPFRPSLLLTPRCWYTPTSWLEDQICTGSTSWGVCVWIPYVAIIACSRIDSAISTICTTRSVAVPCTKNRYGYFEELTHFTKITCNVAG